MGGMPNHGLGQLIIRIFGWLQLAWVTIFAAFVCRSSTSGVSANDSPESMKGHFCIAGGPTRAKRSGRGGRNSGDGGEKRLSLVVPDIKESRSIGSMDLNNRSGPNATTLQTPSPLYYHQATYNTPQPAQAYGSSYSNSHYGSSSIATAYTNQANRGLYGAQSTYSNPTIPYNSYSSYSQTGASQDYYGDFSHYQSRPSGDMQDYYYNSSLGVSYLGFPRDSSLPLTTSSAESSSSASLFPAVGRVKTNPTLTYTSTTSAYSTTNPHQLATQNQEEIEKEKYGFTFESVDELFLPATGDSGPPSPADNRSPSPTREWRGQDGEQFSTPNIASSYAAAFNFNQAAASGDYNSRGGSSSAVNALNRYQTGTSSSGINQVSSSSWRGEDQLKSVMTPQGLTYKRRREEQEKEALMESDFLLNEEDEKNRPTTLDPNGDPDSRRASDSRDESATKADSGRDTDTSLSLNLTGSRYSNPQSVGWAAKKTPSKPADGFFGTSSTLIADSQVDSPPETPRERPQMVLPPPQAPPRISLIPKPSSERFFFKQAPSVCSFDLPQAVLCVKNAIRPELVQNQNLVPYNVYSGNWVYRTLPITNEFERLAHIAATKEEKIYTRDYQIPDVPSKASAAQASMVKRDVTKKISGTSDKENQDPRVQVSVSSDGQVLADSTNKGASKKKSNLKSKSALDREYENKDHPPEVDYRSTHERDDDLIAVVHLLRLLGIGPNEPLNYTSHLRKLISENLRVENIPESKAAKQNVEFLIELLGVNRRKPGLNESKSKPPRRSIICKHYASSSGCHNHNCMYRHEMAGFAGK